MWPSDELCHLFLAASLTGGGPLLAVGVEGPIGTPLCPVRAAACALARRSHLGYPPRGFGAGAAGGAFLDLWRTPKQTGPRGRPEEFLIGSCACPYCVSISVIDKAPG